MNIKAIKTKVFKENENLLDFVLKYVPKLKDGDILVVTSKIVALSEGRTAVCKTEKEKEKIIKTESNFALKTKIVWLTIKDGMVMASAGLDASNGNKKLVLLPKDSFSSAEKIRSFLCSKFKIKNLGVIISDSALMPLRAGVVGAAVGYAGFQGVKNYKGEHDIFGRKLLFSRTNVADSLATSATLCMGEGNEQQPLAIISGAPVTFVKKVNKKETRINPKADIFMPILKGAQNKSHAKKK